MRNVAWRVPLLTASIATAILASPTPVAAAQVRAWIAEPTAAAEQRRPPRDPLNVDFESLTMGEAACQGHSMPCQLRVANDSFFPNQWHLRNPRRNGGADTADINVLDAWIEHTEGDTSIVIAIIELDSIDFDHPDLVGNRWSNPEDHAEHGRDFSGCDSVGEELERLDSLVATCSVKMSSADPADAMKHGTAVAGLAAAVGGNGIGVTGVCPRCRFMSLVIGRDNPVGRVAAALFYAISKGARIINISLDRPNLLIQAVDAVANPWPDSISIVEAPGEDSVDACGELGSDTGLIIVGASDAGDRRILRSNFGPCLSLLAPGGVDGTMRGITTTDVRGPAGHNKDDPPANCRVPELSNLDYTACFGGTSAAAPIVSGVIGLMLSVNPDLTRQQVKHILETTAEKIDHENANYVSGFSTTHGHGRVNATAAVKCARNRDLPCLAP